MSNRFPMHAMSACFLAVGLVTVGCDGRSPSGPTPGATSTPPPPPAGPPAAIAPTISSVTPSTGGTTGGTLIRVNGRGFRPGAKVSVDGVETATYPVENPNIIDLPVLPHPAGNVDVVVINPDGQRAELRGGFSYQEESGPLTPGPAPSIRSVSPETGIIGGGTPVKITGSGFQPGATLTLGGVRIRPNVFDDTMFIVTLPHAPALVDVVVTNPDGQNAVRVGGYRFAAPQSLNFNGRWVGAAGGHWEYVLLFTITDNILVSLSCNGIGQIISVPPLINGEFSSGAISGKFFSASYGSGRLTFPECGDTPWEAWKE